MEFAELGKHCEWEGCKQLDFLPFVCQACKKTFCLEHRESTSHRCTFFVSKEIPQCPICSQIVHIKEGEDPNRKVDEHIAQGCPKELDNNQKYFRCSFARCKGTEVVPMICDKCKLNFCVPHRLPQDHECEKLVEETQNKGSSTNYAQLRKAIRERIGNLMKQVASKKPTSKKVDIMKMKSSATGNQNVPVEKRFYLEIVYPMESKIQPKLMFFNNNNTIGKVLDIAADAGGIENRNNKANSDKLCLVSLKNGHPLDTSLKLEDCGEVLLSGDSVLLERLEAQQK